MAITISVTVVKLERLRDTISKWLWGREISSEDELWSLIGRLVHSCDVVWPGKYFDRRMLKRLGLLPVRAWSPMLVSRIAKAVGIALTDPIGSYVLCLRIILMFVGDKRVRFRVGSLLCPLVPEVHTAAGVFYFVIGRSRRLYGRLFLGVRVRIWRVVAFLFQRCCACTNAGGARLGRFAHYRT